MDISELSSFSTSILGIFLPIGPQEGLQILIIGLIMLCCLIVSALCSSAENAFFSHKDSDLEELSDSGEAVHKAILTLLSNPKKLLATILLVNSLANIAFVITSLFFYDLILNSAEYPVVKFLIDTIFVTLIILIFGEVVPKVYATRNYRRTAEFLVHPMRFFVWLVGPFANLLEKLGYLLEKNAKSTGPSITTEEISQAIDLTTDEDDAAQEKEILKGIVNMANIQVKQIMCSRLDMAAISSGMNFHQVLNFVRENGYSRMPVYKDTPDEILGILNVKSLLPYLDEHAEYNWQSLIYPPYYVPENKPIDDLLNELQQKRLHMVIVVDEFGGTSGLVTLEDLLEEVFGELNDEFDEISEEYQKFGENTYVFDGKTLVIDFLREMDLPVDYFTDKDYDADSLAGLITEEIGRIPKRGESAEINGLKFRVESADLKKVKKVRVILPENREEMTSEEN